MDFDDTQFLVNSLSEMEILGGSFSAHSDGFLSLGQMEKLLLWDSEIEQSAHSSVEELEPVMDLQLIENHLMGEDEVQEDSFVIEEDLSSSGAEEELIRGRSVADLLMIGAGAVQTEKWQLASSVISRLTHLLSEAESEINPFNRLVCFFTQGLKFKCLSSYTPAAAAVPADGNMSALQLVQGLSPYVKFAHFTANQAILEASQGETHVHVIDFNVMEGIQWPPLMVDLALRKDVSLRITAIVDNHNVDLARQTARRLREFADSISLEFAVDPMVVDSEEDFHRIEAGGILIANCMIRDLHPPKRSFTSVGSFLQGVIKLSPKMVVLVEEELFNFMKIPSMSFTEFFSDALEHYCSLFDSLLCAFGSRYKEGLKLIEEFLRQRIVDCLRQFPSEKKEKALWEDGFSSLKGFKPVPISAYNVSQARFLVGLFHGSYWVQHEKCRLALCWKSRPLTTASIWVPTA